MGFFDSIKKIFNSEDSTETKPSVSSNPSSFKSCDLEAFVTYITKSLVDNPDEVKISTIKDRNIEIIQISCNKADIGKIIGKSGKTIASVRTLVSGAAARNGFRADVRILE